MALTPTTASPARQADRADQQRHDQRTHRQPELDDALDGAEHPTHDTDRCESLDQRVGVDVDDRVGNSEQEHGCECNRQGRRRGDEEQGRRPQHDADTEVRGDPTSRCEHERGEATDQPTDSEHRLHQTDSGVAEIEKLERNRDGEHDRRAGDDRLQAIQRCDER